jgi:hypothetical protein
MIEENEICSCGHGKMYHVMERKNKLCNFIGCRCPNYNINKKKKKSDTFLGAFTYTEDEICKCRHGIWDHGWNNKKECGHYVLKSGEWERCSCKKFVSKVKTNRRLNKWKKKKTTKSVPRVKRR